jgi:hypothetical protein
MSGRDTVELVRVEEPERFFDREAVLGRDTTSVFPSTARNAALVDFAASAGESKQLGGLAAATDFGLHRPEQLPPSSSPSRSSRSSRHCEAAALLKMALPALTDRCTKCFVKIRRRKYAEVSACRSRPLA